MNGSNYQLFPDASVLVVEDNKVNQKVIVAMLKRFGIAPDVAVNGKEAVTMAAEKKYDLILMDCIMPVMNGCDACVQIRNSSPDNGIFHTEASVPILAMTANTEEEDVRRCKEAGMNDVITKPAELNDLAEKLNRWCQDCHSGSACNEVFQPLGDFFLKQGGLLDEKTITELYEVMGKDIKIALDAFVQSASEKLKELSAALKDNQTEQVKSIAHNLNGMSSNIGALQMGKICKTILTLADYDNTLEIEPYLNTLYEHYQQVQAAIKRFVAEYC